MKKSKFLVASLLMVSALCVPTCPQAATVGTTKTQVQLEKLLADESTDTIEITTSKSTTLTIPKGQYNKEIVIDAPNARIVNSGKFSGITVNHAIKYTEKAKGNSLNITDNKLSVKVASGALLENIAVSNKKASLHLVADGNVSKFTINNARIVGIHGVHSKPINIVLNDENTKINASSPITFTIGNIQNKTVMNDTIKSDVDLSEIKKQAYDKAYSDWMNYLVTQYQNSNKSNTNTNTNTSQSNEQTNNESSSTVTSGGAIEVTNPDDTVSDEPESLIEEPSEPKEPSESITTYQMTFTHWNNDTSFNTYTGRSQYVYLSNKDDVSTPLEGTEWQVTAVSNNESVNDESLEWTTLSEATCISGISDSTYYANAYKLTFNEGGTYYLRAKCNDEYVYSVPITVYADNTVYLETEFDGKTYLTQTMQVSNNNASFKITGCAPEDIEALANVKYIKYKNSSTLHRGLAVSYVRADLDSYCIYYTYNQTDDYNSSGDLMAKTYYNDNCKPIKVESYTNGVMSKTRVTTYDELNRTYTVVTTNYRNGKPYSMSGYYYTYDEDGKQTFHNGFPT